MWWTGTSNAAKNPKLMLAGKAASKSNVPLVPLTKKREPMTKEHFSIYTAKLMQLGDGPNDTCKGISQSTEYHDIDVHCCGEFARHQLAFVGSVMQGFLIRLATLINSEEVNGEMVYEYQDEPDTVQPMLHYKGVPLCPGKVYPCNTLGNLSHHIRKNEWLNSKTRMELVLIHCYKSWVETIDPWIALMAKICEWFNKEGYPERGTVKYKSFEKAYNKLKDNTLVKIQMGGGSARDSGTTTFNHKSSKWNDSHHKTECHQNSESEECQAIRHMLENQEVITLCYHLSHYLKPERKKGTPLYMKSGKKGQNTRNDSREEEDDELYDDIASPPEVLEKSKKTISGEDQIGCIGFFTVVDFSPYKPGNQPEKELRDIFDWLPGYYHQESANVSHFINGGWTASLKATFEFDDLLQLMKWERAKTMPYYKERGDPLPNILYVVDSKAKVKVNSVCCRDYIWDKILDDETKQGLIEDSGMKQPEIGSHHGKRKQPDYEFWRQHFPHTWLSREHSIQYIFSLSTSKLQDILRSVEEDKLYNINVSKEGSLSTIMMVLHTVASWRANKERSLKDIDVLNQQSNECQVNSYSIPIAFPGCNVISDSI